MNQLNLFDGDDAFEKQIESDIAPLIAKISCMKLADKVSALNIIRAALHEVSPFAEEPVDCVLWVKNATVFANDYNPNSVAPTEMKLLELSILQDGYTQPIVTMPTAAGSEVVDGFHRNRVGKESKPVKERVRGYLPVVRIKSDRTDKPDRMAATIRHNRARGAHKVDSMSEIVVELKRRNWSDEKIGKELGMDADEVLRLTQISGLAEMFKDRDFSEAWEIEHE
jgi:ParB-like chromosome segregation protein Spo0J